MGRPITKDSRPTSFSLSPTLIKYLKSYAYTSEQAVSEIVENLLLSSLSKNSNLDFGRIITKEIMDLEKENEDLLKKVEENNVLISKKKKDLRIANTESSKYESLMKLLDKDLEEKKQQYVNILIQRLLNKDPISEIKKYAIQHSILLSQKYTWQQLLNEAMKKTKKIK